MVTARLRNALLAVGLLSGCTTPAFEPAPTFGSIDMMATADAWFATYRLPTAIAIVGNADISARARDMVSKPSPVFTFVHAASGDGSGQW